MKNINRREFVKTGSVAVAASPLLAAIGCTPGQKKGKPNILFVFTDQQTIKAMSATSNPYINTPAMDNIAANGIRFKLSYCAAPVCSPSRNSMLTSLMPHENGVNWNDMPADPDIPNMGDIFRDAGYHTVWAGKWHLPESYPLRAESRQKSIKGFELLKFYDSTKNWPEWGSGDITDSPLADAVVEFLKNYNGQNPFLLSVSFCNPHDICHVPRELEPKRYPVPDILPPLPANFEIDPNEPEFVQHRRQHGHYSPQTFLVKDWDERRWRAYIHHYYRMTERVDAQFDRILDALRQKGLEEETLIIFTSDHGDGTGSHKWAAKLNLYEEATKVPLLMSWKGKIPPGVIDNNHIVSGLDILPTMCDYAGINISPEFRGKSVRPIIENPDSKWRDFVVTELADDSHEETRKGRMVRTERYKYNLYSHGKRNEQLFDLINDPGETQNLAFEPGMQTIKDAHRKMLDSWMEKTNDDFKIF